MLLPLAGEFQTSNALVAAGLAIATGEAPRNVFAALEKLTSRLFDDYARRSFAVQRSQSGLNDSFGIVSPAISLR